jgi:hypothetical protein
MNKVTMQAGERYGRLVVVDPMSGSLKARVHCDCGTEKEVWRNSLRMGKTISCGCMRKEHMVATGSSRKRHGQTSHPLWAIWYQRKMACQSEWYPSFKHYGGRGVKMHEPWAQDFAVFLRDIGEPPPGMRLTRMDPQGDFVPGNIVWTRKTRSRW